MSEAPAVVAEVVANYPECLGRDRTRRHGCLRDGPERPTGQHRLGLTDTSCHGEPEARTPQFPRGRAGSNPAPGTVIPRVLGSRPPQLYPPGPDNCRGQVANQPRRAGHPQRDVTEGEMSGTIEQQKNGWRYRVSPEASRGRPRSRLRRSTPQPVTDTRIAPIYEGTNGIRAIDLVTRKLIKDDGRVVLGMLEEMDGCAEDLRLLGGRSVLLGNLVNEAVRATRATSLWLLDQSRVAQDDVMAGETLYLQMFGDLVGGGCWRSAPSSVPTRGRSGSAGRCGLLCDRALGRCPGACCHHHFWCLPIVHLSWRWAHSRVLPLP